MLKIIRSIKRTVYLSIAYCINYGIYNSLLGRTKFIKDVTLGDKLAVKQCLTKSEKDSILNIWEDLLHLKKIDWDFFSVYKGIVHPSNIHYYIPDSIWYRYFDLFLTSPRKSYAIDDKNFYDLYYFDVKKPRTILRIMGGVCQTADYHSLSVENGIRLCNAEGRVIIKKSVDSEGGKGVTFWNKNGSLDELKQILTSEQNLIIQEIVPQHPELAKLHANSLNTIRIMTLLIDGEVKILSSVIRMGVGGSKVDNASSGGIVCGISSNGQLKNFACNTKELSIKNTIPRVADLKM